MSVRPSPSRVWLAGYAVAYGVLACLLVIALWQRSSRTVFIDEPVRVIRDPNHAAIPQAEGRLDPNTAEWYDLDRLPGLGEKLCREVVAHRQRRLDAWRLANPDADPAAAPPAFARPEDLLEVRGIGPKMLERLRPHLRFPGEPAAPSPGSMETLSPAGPETGSENGP